MPLVAIGIGLIMIDLAFRGTEHEFAAQLENDFGGGEFWAWAAAIWIIGAVGSVKGLEGVSKAAMALVIVVLVLQNGGFISQASAIITNIAHQTPTQVPISPTGQGSTNPASSSLQGAASSILGGVQNPYFGGGELTPGVEPPATGGGFGQF